MVDSVFNVYGLPTEVKQTTQVYSGASNNWPSRTRTSTYTYSEDGATVAADGYFPFEVTNAANHKVTTTTDISTGSPLTITDPNSVVTSHSYDPLRRVISTDMSGFPAQYVGYTFGG